MAKAPKSTALTSAAGAMASTATLTDQPVDQAVATTANAEQSAVGEGGSESSATETTSQAADGIQSANTEQTDSAQPSQPVSTPASAEQPAAGEQGNVSTVSDPEPPEQPTAVEPAIAETQPVYKVRVINQSRQALFLQPVKTNLAKGGDQTFEFAHQDAANELASFCRQVNLAQKSDVLRFIHLGA